MNINTLRDYCHDEVKQSGWWDKDRNDGELIALMHSELINEFTREYSVLINRLHAYGFSVRHLNQSVPVGFISNEH